MGALRPIRLLHSLILCTLAGLFSGCSKPDDCVFFSVRFQGIGHLGKVSPDSSVALDVSGDGTEVVGAALDQHTGTSTTFDPGPAGIFWSEKSLVTFWCGTPGVGIERLPLCDEASLQNPVRATALGMSADGRQASGSASCAGVDVPVSWTCSALERLSIPSMQDGTAGKSGAASGMVVGVYPAFVGFVSPAAALASEDTIRAAAVWTKGSGSTFDATTLTHPPGATSSEGAAIIAAGAASSGWIAGVGYDETVGRAMSSVPAAWTFHQTTIGGGPMPWKGYWTPIQLADETGAPAHGAATSITENTVVFGHIVKGGTAQAAMWPLAGGANPVSAMLLPTPGGLTGAYVTDVGHDGTVAVGYGLTSSGTTAIAYVSGHPFVVKDEVNAWYPGTVPSDWDLEAATAVAWSADDVYAKASLTPLSWSIVGKGRHGGVPEGWVLHLQRVKLKWWQCWLFPLRIFHDPHIYKWPPKFPPPNPAFRAAVAAVRR